MCRRFDIKRAFTLVELLVVITIIGVLIALLLPAVQAAREAARRSQCNNHVKQISLGLLNYENNFRTLPPPCFLSAARPSWLIVIAPFLDQQAVYDRFKFGGGGNEYSDGRAECSEVFVPTLFCPSLTRDRDREAWEVNDGMYTAHYYGVMGPYGTNSYAGSPVAYTCAGTSESYGGYCAQGTMGFPGGGVVLAEIGDGTSNTSLVGELAWEGLDTRRSWVRGYYYNSTYGNLVFWARNVRYPINSRNTTTWTNTAFGSVHPGGCHFAMVDGSTRFLSDVIDMNVYLALASRNGQEVASPP